MPALSRLRSALRPSGPAAAGAVRADRLTRGILCGIVGLQGLGMAIVAVLLLIAGDGQDKVAAAASRRAVETALALQQRRIIGLVTDAANWDEAVDNLHNTVNPEWTGAYFNQDYIDSVEIDDVFVFAPGNRLSFRFARGGAEERHPGLVEASGIARVVDAVRQLAPGTTPSTIGFIRLNDTVHIVAASRIRYVDDSRSPPPEQSSILVVAYRLDFTGLQALAEDHTLEPLAMLPGQSDPASRPGEERLLVNEFGTNQPIGTLVWHPERAGRALLARAATPAGLALALMLGLVLMIGRWALGAGRALDAAAAEIEEARSTLEVRVSERTAALRQAEARLRNLFEHSAEGIFQLAEDGRYISVNPAMAAIFGYASVEEFLASAPDHTRQDVDKRDEFRRLIGAFGKVSDFVSRARRLDASPIWISQNARLVRADDGSVFYEGMLSDITHRKRIEEQLVHDALHDPLTNLPNRKLFEERLTQALARIAPGSPTGPQPAVLLVDCDRFKLINDSLGHAAGDELIVLLAQRLSLCLRRADTLARLGGDEFAVLTDNGAQKGTRASLHLAARLQAACRRPFVLRDREVFVSLSIGAAEAGPDCCEPSEIVRNADIAMYQAKARGRGMTVAFTPDMHSHVLNRLRIESELRQALANDELRVVYQPIIALDGGHLAGFEALVRWQHPERGLIAPVEFIPVAEESRLIQPLGEIVLRKAAEDMAEWLTLVDPTHPLFVSVNLSPLQLEAEDLVERIAGILTASSLSPHRLKLEITETAMMSNPVTVRAKLAALDALGVRLCIDDFGTGYSSLSQLYSYPFDTLKIDRSFISKLLSGEDGMAVVRSILTLAENLRLAVVAEGVEEQAQRDWLRAHGCTFAQGYLFARPLPAGDATALLRQASTPPRAVA